METERLYILILSVLFSVIVGMVGYWLKLAHTEFKQLIKELTLYTNKLKELIVGIQTHIDKGIDEDIREVKSDIKTLYGKTSKNETTIASISHEKQTQE